MTSTRHAAFICAMQVCVIASVLGAAARLSPLVVGDLDTCESAQIVDPTEARDPSAH